MQGSVIPDWFEIVVMLVLCALTLSDAIIFRSRQLDCCIRCNATYPGILGSLRTQSRAANEQRRLLGSVQSGALQRADTSGEVMNYALACCWISWCDALRINLMFLLR